MRQLHTVSSSAKANDPVTTASPVCAGSPAFAGGDTEFVASTSHQRSAPVQLSSSRASSSLLLKARDEPASLFPFPRKGNGAPGGRQGHWQGPFGRDWRAHPRAWRGARPLGEAGCALLALHPAAPLSGAAPRSLIKHPRDDTRRHKQGAVSISAVWRAGISFLRKILRRCGRLATCVDQVVPAHRHCGNLTIGRQKPADSTNRNPFLSTMQLLSGEGHAGRTVRPILPAHGGPVAPDASGVLNFTVVGLGASV